MNETFIAQQNLARGRLFFPRRGVKGEPVTLNEGHFGPLTQQRLSTSLTVETVRMEGVFLAGGHHVSFHVLPATGALGAPSFPVILKRREEGIKR